MMIRKSWLLMTALSLALVFASGCKDEGTDKNAVEEKAGVETSEKKAALVPTDLPLFTSSAVLGYGTVQSMDALKKLGSDLMTKFQFFPAAAIPSMLEESVKGQLQVTSLEWMDQGKPMAFLLGSETSDSPGAFCIPLKDKALFERSLPSTAAKNKDGNALALAGAMDGTLYINFVGESHAVFTEDKVVFAALKSALEKDLPNLKPKQVVEGTLHIQNLTKAFSKDIASARKELLAAYEGDALGAAGSFTKEDLARLFDMVNEMGSFSMGLEVKDGFLLVNGDVVATPKSTLAGLFQAAASVKSALVYELPETSFLVVGGSADPNNTSWKALGLNPEEQFDSLIAAIASTVEFSAEETKDLKAGGGEFQANLSGDSAFSLYEDKGFPLAMVLIMGAKDGAAAQKAGAKFYNTLWAGMGRSIAKEMENELPPGMKLDLSSLTAAIKSVQPMMAPMGVTLEQSVKAGTDGVTVDFLRITVNYDALPLGPEEKTVLNGFKGVFGNTFEIATGVSKDRVGVSFGPRAALELQSYLKGEGQGTKGLLKGTTDRGRKQISNLLYVNVIDFLKSLSSVPVPQAEVLKGLEGVAAGQGFAITAGSEAVDSYGFTLDLSLDDMAALVRAFKLSPM